MSHSRLRSIDEIATGTNECDAYGHVDANTGGAAFTTCDCHAFGSEDMCTGNINNPCIPL